MVDISEFDKADSIVVGPFGYCMYGADHDVTQLSTEHVLPKGLGGGLIVLQGSCEDCRKKTQAFETEALEKNWKLFRAANELPTSRPKNRPTHAPAIIPNGAGYEETQIPLNKIPSSLIMPTFQNPPAIFTGAPPGSGGLGYELFTFKRGAAEPVAGQAKRLVGVKYHFELIPAIQLILKIAHGYMFIHYEMDHLKPLLPKFFIDRDWHGLYQVLGRSNFQPPPFTPSPKANTSLHTFGACLVKSTWNDKLYMRIDVQLFAAFGVPPFCVVAAEASDVPKKRAQAKPPSARS